MDHIDTALMGAFTNYRLSKDDGLPLREYLLKYKGNVAKLREIQEKSFAMVGEYLQRQPTFDAHAFGWLETLIKVLEDIKYGEDPRHNSCKR